MREDERQVVWYVRIESTRAGAPRATEHLFTTYKDATEFLTKRLDIERGPTIVSFYAMVVEG